MYSASRSAGGTIDVAWHHVSSLTVSWTAPFGCASTRWSRLFSTNARNPGSACRCPASFGVRASKPFMYAAGLYAPPPTLPPPRIDPTISARFLQPSFAGFLVHFLGLLLVLLLHAFALFVEVTQHLARRGLAARASLRERV